MCACLQFSKGNPFALTYHGIQRNLILIYVQRIGWMAGLIDAWLIFVQLYQILEVQGASTLISEFKIQPSIGMLIMLPRWRTMWILLIDMNPNSCLGESLPFYSKYYAKKKVVTYWKIYINNLLKCKEGVYNSLFKKSKYT